MPRLALSVRRHKRRFAAKGRELKLVVIDYHAAAAGQQEREVGL
jgi:hypothetical protein